MKSAFLMAALAALPLSLLFAPKVGAQPDAAFSGQRAFEDIGRLVAFGPRPVGSVALARSRRWMIRELTRSGCSVTHDPFTASTPVGNIDMDNLIVKIPGAKPSVIMVAGHYDTKTFKNFRFVGANDGGSSAAFLLELGRTLCHTKNKYTLWLVFFDGEEAIDENMTPTDGTYGSRHLEQKLAAGGDLGKIQAMILVDMIADKNLDIRRDMNSTAWLNTLLFKTADRLGYSRYFLKNQITAIGDDHTPFVAAGVSSVDIIDLDYGPDNSYWHTAQDTPEHCSAASLEIVGRVVTAMLKELESSPHVQ
ncbi:MAG: M28 family peptidase [Acidobacteriota bacterium]|nr:M28 family peptidase [Acidobacteriota bacterium]